MQEIAAMRRAHFTALDKKEDGSIDPSEM